MENILKLNSHRRLSLNGIIALNIPWPLSSRIAHHDLRNKDYGRSEFDAIYIYLAT